MFSTFGSRARHLTGAVLVLAVLGATGGCSTESGGPATSASSDDEVAQNATAAIEKLYGDGTFVEPSSTGPEAQSGYKVALVSSGVQSPTGTSMANGAKAAAKLLGWDFSVYDGKYEPSEYQEGIRQAISQDADAIWLYSIDCPLVKTALDEAKKAGIPVFSQEAADCSDVDPSEPSYYERSLEFVEGDFIAWGEGLGAAEATWLLSKLGSKADIIEVSNTELVITKAVHDGFQKAMKEECPDCKVTTLNIRLADFGPVLQEKISTALLRNPAANGMALSYDDLVTSGGAAAVMASGRNDSMEVVSGSGYAANIDLVRRNKGQDAGWTYDGAYEAWSAADMINRFFAGEESVPSGVGISMFDHDHDLPPEGEGWSTGIDYEPVFKTLWGVS
ncbi:ribose transport system substrate-binding protein [Nocardioides alpinus]|uniref:Sugar ABC transporter substrate-binding protein n=2 Tax=Nocardioides TaxID=1839 RepID=A0A4Q2SK95_9ACTN|nr:MULTISPECIES: substrate-binding domain-containing protein [Nocardioides]PKH38513.1 sugar ABC transporter substrate-binding protein [Nocardioides alpinus]RYC05341.1 sugar ABC transporter substrate-binding protein [Nocardioides zhouii]SFB47559.1 ribose transport system substrate-binding protein [Nocardioides alpinus]